MRLVAGIALVLAALCSQISAQQVFPGFPPGIFTNKAAMDPSGAPPPSFQGAADIVASPIFWVGLRAMSAADRGNALVNVCTVIVVTDTCADFSSDATTGFLVISTIGGLSCAVVTCTIKTFYDRAGTNCSGPFACDFVQATISQRAQLIVNCQGTLPCARALGSNTPIYLTANNMPSTAQPVTVSTVINRTSAFTTQAGVYVTNSASFQLGFASTSGQVFMYTGNALPVATASNSALHAMQAIFDSAGSPSIYIDGSSTAMVLSSTTGIAAPAAILNDTGSGTPFSGDFYELGAWGLAFNGTQQSNMNTNQHSSTSGWNF